MEVVQALTSHCGARLHSRHQCVYDHPSPVEANTYAQVGGVPPVPNAFHVRKSLMVLCKLSELQYVGVERIIGYIHHAMPNTAVAARPVRTGLALTVDTAL